MRRIASVEHLVCVFSCVVAVSLRYLDHFQDIREEIEPKECFYSVIYLDLQCWMLKLRYSWEGF